MGYHANIGGHTLTGIDGRLLRVDNEFCEMLQMMEGDLLGRDIIDITHPDDRGDTQVDMRRLRDQGRNFSIRKRYIRADGLVIWAQAQASIIATSAGEKMIAGFIEQVMRDPMLELRRARDVAIFDSLARLSEVRRLDEMCDVRRPLMPRLFG